MKFAMLLFHLVIPNFLIVHACNLSVLYAYLELMCYAAYIVIMDQVAYKQGNPLVLHHGTSIF
jgi:hypothetical protein